MPIEIAIASFAGKLDNQPRQRHVTWETLSKVLTSHAEREEKDGPLWSPTLYQPDAVRAKRNVVSVSCLVLDFDHETDPTRFTGDWSAWEYAMHTTFRHTETEPRWRVVFPFKTPVPASEWPYAWGHLIGLFSGATTDKSCKDASRIYYLPACRPNAPRAALVNHGRFLDPADFLRPPAPLLVEKAKERLGEGRNNAGMWLACQMRDNEYTQNETEAVGWHREVPRERVDPTGQVDVYDEEEWRETVRKVYSSPQREPWSVPRDDRSSKNGTPPEMPLPAETSEPDADEPVLFRKFLTFKQALNRPAPEYLVDGLLFERSLIEIFGPPNHGKTFATLDLSLCIRRGGLWCGREIHRPGAVVYVNADGGLGFYDRLRAWETLHPDEEAEFEFYTYPESISLHRPNDMVEFRAALSYLPQQPVLVVFDTYSRCIPGVNENLQEHASLVIWQLDKIREEIESSVSLIHHTDKAGEKDRGSSVVLGACDTQIRVDKTEAKIVRFSCEKQRDTAFFEPLYFSLDRIEGTDFVWLQQANAEDQPAAVRKEDKLRQMTFLILSRPGITCDDLAEPLKTTRRTVQRYAEKLFELGVIEIKELSRSPFGGAIPRGLFPKGYEGLASGLATEGG